MSEYVEVGSVYVIVHPEHDGYVKVGKAKNFVKRLQAYQTYCPHGGYTAPKVYAVALDAMDRAEKHAHAALKEYRHRGEWFQIEPEDAIQVLDDALSQFQIGISDESLREMHRQADNKRNAAWQREQWEDPEKRVAVSEKNKQKCKDRYYANHTAEKTKRMEAARLRRANLTDEQRELEREKQRQRMKKLREERKA